MKILTTIVGLLWFSLSSSFGQTVEDFCPDILSPASEDSCGVWQQSGDSFEITYRGCLDLQGRQRGLVIRIDTTSASGARQGFRCRLAVDTGDEFIGAFLPAGFDSGFYNVQAVVNYGNPDQMNESFFLQTQDGRGPCGNINFKDFLVIVPDESDQGEVSQIEAGEFYLKSGDLLFLKHLHLLKDELDALPTEERAKFVKGDGFQGTESVHLMELRLTKTNKESAISLSKSANKSTVMAGDELEYKLGVSNPSISDTARTIVLTDTLPTDVTLDPNSIVITPESFETTPDIAGNIIEWRFPQFLLPSENIEVSYSVTVNTSENLPAILRNIGHVESSCGPATHEVDVRVEPDDSPDVTVEKSADRDSVGPGDAISYTLKITNLSNVTAENVVVEDVLPNFVRVDTSDFGAMLQWALGDLAPGAEVMLTVDALVSASAACESVLINCAEVQADNEDSDFLSNNTNCDSVSITCSPCDLSLTKTVSEDCVSPGQEFQYRLSISKATNDPLQNVVLSDTLSQALTALDWPGTTQGDILSLVIPTLVQSDTTITFTARVSSSLPSGTTELLNRAGVMADCEDDFENNFVVSTVALCPGFDCIVLDRNVFEPEIFNGSLPQELQISFELDRAGRVEMKLYDTAADFITTVTDQDFGPGQHIVQWDGLNDRTGQAVGSGVYIIVFRFDNVIECITKVIITR